MDEPAHEGSQSAEPVTIVRGFGASGPGEPEHTIDTRDTRLARRFGIARAPEFTIYRGGNLIDAMWMKCG